MNGQKKKVLNTTQLIIIICFVLLIAAIGIAAFFIIKAQKEYSLADESIPGGNLIVDESNLAEVDAYLSDSVATGMFEVSMNTIWSFPDGKSASTDAYVANSPSNHFPITFEILLDNSDMIYSSTVIPVGNRIKDIVLERDLDAGTYPAVCMYHLWNEDGTEDSSFGVNVTINVLE